MKRLQGKISITVPSSNTPDNRKFVRVEMCDELSGSRFLDISIPIDTWTLATVGNLSYCNCEFELHPDYVGMRNEHKSEIVYVEKQRSYSRADQRLAELEALKEWEVDGWSARAGDISNHHRRKVDLSTETHDAYEVTFFRYVEQEGAND